MPATDAGDEVAGLGCPGAEAQRVERRDRPRAHREHVAQDAADAGRRALVGLDVAGWLWLSILKIDAIAVADVDTPAFSPGPRMTRWPVVGSVFSQILEDLYEQCSFHIAEKMPSSVSSARGRSSARLQLVLAGLEGVGGDQRGR
jgi:hypothetical protein